MKSLDVTKLEVGGVVVLATRAARKHSADDKGEVARVTKYVFGFRITFVGWRASA